MDTTGDGKPDSFDTNGDGQIDAFDTTGDGEIDKWMHPLGPNAPKYVPPSVSKLNSVGPKQLLSKSNAPVSPAQDPSLRCSLSPAFAGCSACQLQTRALQTSASVLNSAPPPAAFPVVLDPILCPFR